LKDLNLVLREGNTRKLGDMTDVEIRIAHERSVL
jgi:hypothetical protein